MSKRKKAKRREAATLLNAGKEVLKSLGFKRGKVSYRLGKKTA